MRGKHHSKKSIEKEKQTKAKHPYIHKLDCKCCFCMSKRGEFKGRKWIYNLELVQEKYVEIGLVPKYLTKGWLVGRLK